MKYDPVKKFLGGIFDTTPFLRKVFYRLLDLLLLRTWHVKKVLREWQRNNPGEKDILDAGSGFGQYVYYLARRFRNCRISGIDIDPDHIAGCRDFFRKAGISHVTFETADLTRFISPESFDLILSVDVMEHIEDDRTVFGHLCSSLRPGGMLVISTPSDMGGSDVHEHGDESFIGEHVRDGYGIEEIREKLAGSGFSRIDAGYSYGAPGKLAWILSMKYPIRLLNASRLFILLIPFYYMVTFPFTFFLNLADVSFRHKTGTGLIVTAFK